MKIFGKELTFNGKRVYHENDKPTPAEIGAAKSDHGHDAMTGASASEAGTAGFVPAPAAGADARYLRSDGTWRVPPDTKYTHPTTSGNKHIPSGGKSGQVLGWSADGTASWTDPSTSGTQVITQSTQPSGHVSGRCWIKTY
ncbi:MULTISPECIES: hypothetical protein [unclassified Candidatus Paralachnospira]|uniref:hypothetical protein n=1 Tax=unclassified Candidatus Paralachnospira TaxID=3099471 RepID=UPI003F91587C